MPARRRIDEAEPPGRDPARRPVVARTPANVVLDLQAGAGNRATTEWIARSALMRDAAPESTGGSVADVEGIGTFEVLSYRLGRESGAAGGGAGRGKRDVKEVLATLRGKALPRLFNAAHSGAHIKRVVIRAGSVTVTATNCVVGTYTDVGGAERSEPTAEVEFVGDISFDAAT